MRCGHGDGILNLGQKMAYVAGFLKSERTARIVCGSVCIKRVVNDHGRTNDEATDSEAC